MSEDEPFTTVAARAMRDEGRRLRDQAAELLKVTVADRKAAEDALGQADHRRREVADIERAVAKREEHLKALGESELLRREAEADTKLREAAALMAQYSKDRHAGAIALQRIDEREKPAKAARELELQQLEEHEAAAKTAREAAAKAVREKAPGRKLEA